MKRIAFVRVRTLRKTGSPLTINPASAAISTATDAGALVFMLLNVPTGSTPIVNHPALIIAGSASNGWRLVRSMEPVTAGTINVTVTAGAMTAAAALVVSDAQSTSLWNDAEIWDDNQIWMD